VKLMNRKTRKVIRKSLRKVIRKHGPGIITGLAAAAASAIATLASTEAAGTGGRKSNLGKLSEKVAGALALADDRGGGRTGKRRRDDRDAPAADPASAAVTDSDVGPRRPVAESSHQRL
jgi:hypothetical protein